MCTLGPSVDSPERMKQLVEAGMDVARFNMSHGDHAEHQRRLEGTRKAAADAGRTVGILCDLQGPKIRLGKFADGPIKVGVGDRFTITIDDILGDQDRCSTTYKGLPGDVKAGDEVLVDDGRVAMRAVEVTDTDVVCAVTVAGALSNNKGINLPGVAVSVPAMSQKDEDDLRWAIQHGADMVALSFVRSADDITRVHEIMDEEGRRVPVIAKLEKPQAIENLDAIIDAFDMFMVARGDLGVELPLEEVPIVQKRIIKAARRWAKPVIVATQMLESMISAPRPTRAEASDVANAVLDGADAVMLSGEVSIGDYPIETVQTMSRIIYAVENEAFNEISALNWDPHTTGGVVAFAAAQVGERLDAKYLVAFTKSGDTARRLSRLRSRIPVLVFTPDESTMRLLTVMWGAHTIMTEEFTNKDDMADSVEIELRKRNLVVDGDRVVIVSGSPMRLPGNTNALRVHKMRPLAEDGSVGSN